MCIRDSFEGAQGAKLIQKLADSYSNNQPTNCDSSKVTEVINFNNDTIYDIEGDLIPNEKMIFIHLEDGRKFAIRPSGTEPKIKFYLFGHCPADKITDENINDIKEQTNNNLTSLWKWIQCDIEKRLA